jgi:RNA polymerase sigma factor (sigma-70 family)
MRKNISKVHLSMSNEEFVEQILTNRKEGDLLIPDGDEEKFRKLYDYLFNERRFGAKLNHICHQLRVLDFRDDILQEVFRTLFFSPIGFDPNGPKAVGRSSISKFENYLFRMLHNQALREARRRRRIIENELGVDLEDPEWSQIDADDPRTKQREREDAESRKKYRSAQLRELPGCIAQLPKKQQQVIVLRLEGLKDKEIAQRMNSNAGAVRKNAFAAWKNLRRCLNSKVRRQDYE